MGLCSGKAIMNRVAQYVIVAALAILIVGGVFLATWDIPAPTVKVEKVVPDDRFPR